MTSNYYTFATTGNSETLTFSQTPATSNNQQQYSKPYKASNNPYIRNTGSRTSTFSPTHYTTSRSLHHSTIGRPQAGVGRKSGVIRIDARSQSIDQPVSCSNAYAKVSSIKSPTSQEDVTISNLNSSSRHLIDSSFHIPVHELPVIPPPMPITTMTENSTLRGKSEDNFDKSLSSKTTLSRNNQQKNRTSTEVANVPSAYHTAGRAVPNVYSAEATLPYHTTVRTNPTTVENNMPKPCIVSPSKPNFELSELSYTNLKSDVESTIKSENSGKGKCSEATRRKLSEKNSWCIIICLFVLLIICFALLLFVTFTKSSSRPCVNDTKSPQCPKEVAKTLLPEVGRKSSKKTSSVSTFKCKSNDKTKDYCMSAECVAASGEIIAKMNTSVDPCIDFYEYSCGGWKQSNNIPPGRSSYSVVAEISERNNKLLHEILTRPIKQTDFTLDVDGNDGNDGITEAEMKAKVFYQSCISLQKINSFGAQPMLQLITEMGGWDALGNWREATWDFNDLLYRIQGLQSSSVFFSISIQLDQKNASKNFLRIDQNGITMPDRSFYLTDVTDTAYGRPTVVFAYKKLIRSILLLLRATDNIDQIVEEIFLFEKNLADIMVPPHELLQAGEDMVTIQELTEISPQIDWFRLFKRIIKKSFVNHSTRISVASKYFLRRMSALIRNSPKRILHNYMMWRAVSTKAAYLSTPFRNAVAEFTASIYGYAEPVPLWKYCLVRMNEIFKLATGALFVRETFSPENKAKIENIANDVKSAFKVNLANVTWMDSQTKEAAMEKVGYEENLLDDPASLNQLYNFPVHDCCYFNNILRYKEHKIAQSVERIFQTSGADELQLIPQTVNAYYSPAKNQMVFPAGLLQNPLFSDNNPSAMNYGAVGSIIGHEMTHGYDNSVVVLNPGGKFDKFGSERVWWTQRSEDKYRTKVQCVVDAYKNFAVGNVYIQSAMTLDENIADIAGLKLAYMAYSQRKSMNQKRIPGVEINNDQLFFVGFAQTWCVKRQMFEYQRQMQQDIHAPERFRVIGSIMQMENFAQVFQCPKKSPMNPSKRCNVW